MKKRRRVGVDAPPCRGMGESLLLASGLELHGEVAHDGCLPGDFHATGDAFATVVDVLQRCGDHVHVVVGVDAARDAEAHEVVAAEAVLAGDGVAVGQQVADLAGADACLQVELDGERLGGELLLGYVGEHLVGVDEDGVAAGGALVGDAVLVKACCQVLDLLDAGVEVVELGVLVQAYGQCLHVAAVHAAVGEVALADDGEDLGGLEPVIVAGGDEAAHVHDAVLLRRHGHAVGQVEHLASDLLDGLVLVAFFADFDEVCVLGEAGGVEDDALAVLVGDGADLAEVLHADGLSAGGVVGDGDDDEGNLVGVLGQALLELLGVYVALEGDFELGVAGLVDGAVDGEGLAGLDVALGGVEVGVAGHVVAFVHECGEEDVLCCPALVGGDYVVEAGEAVDGFLELEPAACAGVALVAHHEGGPLAVAHGARARVGQQVDVDLFGGELEYVVVSVLDPLLTLFAGAFVDGLYHFDFPGFCERKFHGVSGVLVVEVMV